MKKSNILAGELGSTLILIILAIIVVSALALGIAKTSSISTLNQLEFNQANLARNLAYSGVEYAKGLALSYKNQSKTIDEFVSALNSGGDSGTSTYTVGSGVGSFTLTATKASSTSLTLNVEGDTPSGAFQAKYNLPAAVSISYSVSTTNKFKDQVIYSNSSVNISGSAVITGNVTVGSLTIEQATIKGDVVSQGVSKLNYNTTIQGNLCSVGAVTFAQASTVSGNVLSQGNISMPNANTVGGNVWSNGNVSMDNQSKVSGDIEATGAVDLEYGITAYKNVYSDSKLTMGGGGSLWTGGTEPSAHGATIVKNAYIKSTISQGDATSIQGVAVTSDSYSPPKKGTAYYGSLVTSAAYPPNIAPPDLPVSCTSYTEPTLTTFNPPTSPTGLSSPQKTAPPISYQGSSDLSPGWYTALTTGQYSTLTLYAGTYYFDGLTFGYGTRLNLNVTDGDILIFVKGTSTTTINTRVDGSYGGVFIINNGTTYSFSNAPIALAAQVYLEAHGKISLEYKSNWFGTLFSSDTITFGGDNTVVGVYATLSTQSISWSQNITYVQSNYAATHW